IYLSGWQVAADANSAHTMYPDQSLYPVDSVPAVVRRLNNALARADQIAAMERHEGAARNGDGGAPPRDWFVPIVADAEAGLDAARFAADLLDVPTVLVARTDACSARLLTSDVDPRDRAFLTGERTAEGFFVLNGGLDAAIARGLAYAPHADVLWCETQTPDL